jgi:O-antigen/teichoic acid export membrane protein
MEPPVRRGWTAICRKSSLAAQVMDKSRTFKTLMLSSGQIITGLATMVIFAVLARVLSVRDYGSFMQVMLVYSSALPFMAMGLPDALFYFLPRSPERARGIVYENLGILLLMGVVFAGLLLGGGAGLVARLFKNPDLRSPLKLIAWYPLLMLPVLSLPACLLARGRVVPVPVFAVAARATMLLLVVGAGLIWETLTAVVMGLVASALVVVGPGVKLMLSACGGANSKPTWQGAKDQLHYSWPVGAAGLVGVLSLKLNQIVVSSICTPEQFAVYANGAVEIPVVAVVMGSLRSVLAPDFVKLYEEGQLEKARLLWRRATVSVSAILIPVMVYLEVLAPEVMRLVFSAKYEAAAIPFRVLLLLLVMRSISLNSVFLASGNSRFIFYRGIETLLLNVVLSIILVKHFGYVGASVGLVLAMYLWAVPFSLWKSARILRSSVREVYPFALVAKILAASVLAGVILVAKWFWKPLPDSIQIGVGGLLYFPLVYFLFHYLKISDILDLKSLARNVLLKRNYS